MTRFADYIWLFRKAPIMATSIDRDGLYQDINDAMLERLGYRRDQMIGRRPSEFVTAESARRIDEEFLPILRRTGKLENKPIAFIARNGEQVSCITNSLVDRDDVGGPVRTIALYSEATDQTRADFKYRQLYRSTPAMLHTVDADGLIVTVTDHWLNRMGYRREEVVGRPITDFFSARSRKRLPAEKVRAMILAGEYQNEERQLITRDGGVMDVIASAVSERNEAGDVVRMLVASKDVTERNRAERKLRTTLAENARLREELELERDYLREEVNLGMNYGRIVGRSPALQAMLGKIEAVAETPANVLVLGESGVGKELVAHAIHSRSRRADAPLVKVNCAAIPKDLFESEFFGHVKGAFTGAQKDRIGRFQLADGGTLFLDEVGEIPVELQGKLLRVLQEGEIERVGDDITRSVDVRVIAATNRNLEKLVMDGTFREDLFYRLSVFPIDVPPLRKRGDDVLRLAQHFLEATCMDFGRPALKITRKLADEILAYDWPGNVRELKNVIERGVILSKGDVLRLEISGARGEKEISAAAGRNPQALDGVLTEDEMKEFQRRNIERALKLSNWRVSGDNGAARLLGVKPTTLTDRIKVLGLKRPVN